MTPTMLSHAKRRIKKILFDAPIRLSGYEVRRIQSERVADLRNGGNCPTPLEAMYVCEKERCLVEVPADIIVRTKLMDAWIDVIRVYECSGRDAARHRLSTYFEEVQPASVAEFLGISPTHAWHHENALSYVYPWDMHDPRMTRESRVATMRKEAYENGYPAWQETDGWKGFGPVSEAVTDLELRRLLNIYDSIRTTGFSEKHDPIVGRIFANRNIQIIQPRRGWHRVAVCLALGFSKVPMMFYKTHTVVRLEDVQVWPNVKRGYFSRQEAVDIFMRRFESHLDAKPLSDMKVGLASEP